VDEVIPFGRSRRAGVGLDIGGSGIRGAVVTRQGGDLVLTKIGQVALAPGVVRQGQIMQPEVVTQALLELRRALGLGRESVALGCEQHRTYVRYVELPWVPAKSRLEALPLLAADVIPMEAGEAVVDFIEFGDADGAGDGDGGRIMSGLVVAAPVEAVKLQIGAVEAAGFRVTSVDHSGFALVRSIGCRSGEGQGASPTPEALVDVGVGMTTVVIHSGGIPHFARILPRSEDVVIGLLVEGIISSLKYQMSASTDLALSRIAITGGWASAELLENLAEAVSVPVEFESAFRNVSLGSLDLAPEQLRVLAATGAVSVGLAIGQLT